MSLFKNPVHPGTLQLSEGPQGDIGLVGQYVVLVHGADVDILVSDALSEQLEQPEIVCSVVGIVGWGRGKGIPQFCFFLLHGRWLKYLSKYLFHLFQKRTLGRLLNSSPWNMVRRIASQVHKQVSRLMQANYIREEPVWYQAVLQYPPLPFPSRAPPFQALEAENPSRKPFVSSLRPPKTQPLTIKYMEDKLRLQFFRDHPFEAFRPVSIVEGQLVEPEHPVRGKDWTRLSQRTKNPTAEE